MTSGHASRISYIDVESDTRQHEHSHKLVAERRALIASGGRNPQSNYNSLYHFLKSIGSLRYALGYPLSEVRQSYVESVEAYLKVVELRGTVVYKVIKEPMTSEPTQEDWDRTPVTIEYGFGNSNESYQASCLALIANQDDLARQIGEKIWDPDDATYISSRSTSCTRNQHHLAYAFRELLADSPESSEAELKKIHVQKREAAIFYQKKLIRALGTANKALFLDGLSLLVDKHKKRARSTKEVDDYLCIAALGLCKLALKHSVCVLDDFPQDDVHLPLQLIGKSEK
ncbi:hypothetical protein AB1K70_19300 [Bremerella sp. JC770]|uniref:hypothetical protein n=1 Tax=Bremerella sp. JC770 TaxID=3232137 RepID=UPI003457DE86